MLLNTFKTSRLAYNLLGFRLDYKFYTAKHTLYDSFKTLESP